MKPILRTGSRLLLSRVKLLFVLSVLLVSQHTFAQISNYSFTSSSGTWSQITGGTLVASATIDDASYGPYTMPFTFKYNGVTQSTYFINSNGWISFSAASPSTTNYAAISSSLTANGFLCAMNMDLQGQTTGAMRYELQGTAPFRVLVIQWLHWGKYSYTGTGVGDDWNFQIRLYESTNYIQFVYGPMTINANSGTPQIGLRGAANTDYNCRTSPSSNWSSTSAGGSNSATCSITNSVYPTLGRTFQFAPPTPCTSPPTPGTTTASSNPVCSGVSFGLSLSGGTSGTGQTYQWQSSPNNVTWTNISGATSSSLTTTQTVATYYRCNVTCGSTVASAGLLVTMSSPINCYCSSAATVAADEEIFNVTVGTLNNTSTCATTGGAGSTLSLYSNYTSLVSAPNLDKGTTVSYSIQIGTCGGNYTSGTAIFIDWNQNGVFTDAGETILQTAVGTNGPHTLTGTFLVPTDATSGTTIMRVINAEGYYGASLTPCLSYGYGETEDYNVNITVPPPCTDPPVVGTAQSTATLVCASTAFTLSMSSFTSGVGQTYQWQSSPDGISWTAIPSATNSSYSTTQSSTTRYRCNVTCGVSTTTSGAVIVTSDLPTNCYCTPTTTSGTSFGDYCSNVTLETINNTTIGEVSPYYIYYSGLSATLTQGNTYTVSATAGSYTSSNYLAIWMDYNADGDFDDVGEKLGESDALGAYGVYSIPFTVPLSATAGNTRMRVREVYATIGITPCLTYSYGETEDYVITINPFIPCSGAPVAGAASASSTSVCMGNTVTLTNSGEAASLDITYQWQESADAGATWSNIPAATSTSLIATVSSTTDYRLAVTCVASATTSYSDPVEVSTYISPAGNGIGDPIMIASLPYVETNANDASTCYSSTYTGGNEQPSRDVWYQFTTSPCASSLNITTCSPVTTYDTYIHLLDNTGTEITFNDDAICIYAALRSDLSISVTPNTTYYLVVEGAGSDEGTYEVTLTESITLPSVSHSTLASVCENASPFTLSGGAPSGGSYSGLGIIAPDTFDPSDAGVGTSTLTYTYTDIYGCSNTTDVDITVLAAPTVTIDPAGPYCVDAAAVSLNADPHGGSFSGDGMSGDTFTPSAAGAGEHPITYTYSDGSCSNSATTTITVNALPSVTLDLGIEQVCKNDDAFTLSGGAPSGGSYSGEGTEAGIFTPYVANYGSHTITYTYTDMNGCSSQATDDIFVNSTPNISVTPSSATICPGTGSVSLSTPLYAGYTYQWYKGGAPIPGAVSNTYIANTGGTYRCQATTQQGCVKLGPDGCIVTESTPPSATLNLVSASNDLCINNPVNMSVSAPTAVSYQWYKGNYSIAGAISTTYSATKKGKYTVLVTDAAGCSNNSTAIQVVRGCRLSDEDALTSDELNLKLYPNPNSGDFWVEIDNSLSNEDQVTFEVINLVGQIIYSAMPSVESNSIYEDIHLDNSIPSGMYIFRVTVNGKAYTSNIIVTK